MATRLPTCLFRHLPRQIRPAPSTPLRWSVPRAYSTEASPPPLLAKLKGDLKGAMKAKDSARLAVLRAVLAATLNASKTASPITTDAQLVALLRKHRRASEDAAAEFRNAGRQDLVDNEEGQIRVLEEYTSGFKQLGKQELRAVVEPVVTAVLAEGIEKPFGVIMKRILDKNGPLAGQSFDGAQLGGIVKDIIAAQ